MRVPPNLYALAFAVTISFASVCAAKTKEPVFVDPGFRFEDVDTIYVLPTVDLMTQRDQNAEKSLLQVDWMGRYYLKHEGYGIAPEGDFGNQNRGEMFVYKEFYDFEKRRENEAKGKGPAPPARMEVTEDDLKEPEEAWIRKLGPDDARWVLILALEDAESHLTFGATGSAIVMGTLFDRQNGKLVWRAIGTGRAGQGGLIGMGMKSASEKTAIQDAVKELCSMVPKRGGKKK